MSLYSNFKKKATLILFGFDFSLTLLLSSCSASTPKSMYSIGTEWTIGDSTITVMGSSFQPSYQTLSGDIILPDSDCEFIIVECDISLDEKSELESCFVKKSDIYADSYPLFREPLFLTEMLTAKGGNCILLFSIPIDNPPYDLSSYSMNICFNVDGRSYSNDFSFT
jgi:hypothetical protein